MVTTPEPQDQFNLAIFNAIKVERVLVLTPFDHVPTDADFQYPTDGMMCLVDFASGRREIKPDALYVRIGGIWKSINLT